MSNEIILSPCEKKFYPDRPHGSTEHMVGDKYPFLILLAGYRTRAPQPSNLDSTSNIEIVSMPNGDSVHGLHWRTHAYHTLEEAMCVGNGFPEHKIYYGLVERWLDDFERQREGKTPIEGQLSRVALTGVYLFLEESNVPKLRSHPNFDETRLTYLEGYKPRYIFAQGTDEKPLLLEECDTSVRHSDLPVPDYEKLLRLIIESDLTGGLNMDYVTNELESLAISHQMPPTASEEDLRIISAIVSRCAYNANLTMPEDSKEKLQRSLHADWMSRIFGVPKDMFEAE